MADSAFLSRLPIRGSVSQSTGIPDAFKIPLLNSRGKLDPSLIDNKVIYEVENEAARVALPNVVVGDIVLQLNTKAIYVLTTLPSSVDGNWQSLGTGIAYPVTSVSGKTGDIVLETADIVSLDEALSLRILSTDSRLSDSRAPLAHKSSHSSGGSDALTPADIGAAPASHSHTKSQITDFPTLGSASSLDAPFTGDALANQVVLGSDSRLVGNVKTSSIGLAGGIPSLDNTGKVPLDQLPTGIGTAVAKGDKGDKGDQGLPGVGIKGDKGDKGDQGLPGVGIKGAKGDKGDQGLPGVGIKGDKGDQGLPGTTAAKGDKGDAATISVGSTVTGSSGTPAQVANSGTQNAAVLDFTIPRGAPGLDGAFELDNDGNLIPTTGAFYTWGLSEGTFHLDEDGDLTPTEVIVPPTAGGGGTVGYISTATTDDATPTILNYGANNSPDAIVEGQAITFEANIFGHDRAYDTVSSWQITGGVQVTFDRAVAYIGGQPNITQSGNSWGLNAGVAFSVDSSFLPQITVTGISGAKISWGATLTIKNTEQAIQVPLVPGCIDSSADNYNPLAQVDNGSCTYENATSEMFIPIVSNSTISSLTVEAGGQTMFPAFSTSITNYAIKTSHGAGGYVQATVTINGTPQTIYGQVDKLFKVKDASHRYYVRFLNSAISSVTPQIQYGPVAGPGQSAPPAGYWLYTSGWSGNWYIVADENGVPNWYISSSLGSAASLHPGGDINRMAGNYSGSQREIIVLRSGQPEIRVVSPTLGYPDGHEVEELVGPVLDPHDGSNRKLHVLLELEGTDAPSFKLEEQDQNGDVTWSWLSGDWFNNTGGDAFHINSVDVHPVTGNIVLSSRHMSCLFEIDYATKKINWVIQGQYPLTQPFTAYAKQSTINTAKILNIVGEPSGWHGTSGNHDARYQVGLINTNNIIVSAYDDGSFAPVAHARGVIYEINLAQNTATCLSSTMLDEQEIDGCCGSYRIVKNPDGSVSHCFGSANFYPPAIEYVGSPTSSVRTKVYGWTPGYGMYRCVKVGTEQFNPNILRTCWTQTTQPTAYNPPGGGGGTDNLNNGLQGYWNLTDSSWTDATANHNNLTPVGSPTVVSGGLGGGNVAQLTSGTDYLQFPAGLFDVGGGSASVSMWFKLNQTQVGYQWLLTQGADSDYHNWVPCYIENNSQLSFLVAPVGGGWEGGLGTYGITPQANQWYHYVITLDGSLATMYLNGNQVNTFNYSSPIEATGSQFALGGYPAYDGILANGLTNLFERVGLWNRVLTTAEITALYNTGSGVSYPFSSTLVNGVQAYWKLDDSTWADSTPNGYNLTNYGGTTNSQGKIGGDAIFNGGSILKTNNVGPNVNSNFSVSFWINYDPAQNNDVHALGSPFTNGFYVAVSSPGGLDSLRLVLFNGAGIAVSSNPITANTWNHFVLTRNGNTIYGYQNGSLLGTADVTGQTYPGNSDFAIGADILGGYNFIGQFDEVGIWTRALSQSEITSLYNTDSGLTYPFDTQPIVQEGLVTWLDAQSSTSYSGSGNTWNDLTPNGINGTQVGGVTFGTVAGAGAFTTDGSSGYISLSGVPNFGVSNQSLSIGVWVNPASVSGNIVGESAGDPLALWYIPPISAVGGEFDGIIYDRVINGGDMFSGVYNQNSWYYVTLVYDQSTTSKLLYVNGDLVGIENIGFTFGPDNVGYPNPYIFLGRDMQDAVYNAGWFQGSYGALHLYSNKALNSTEVLFNYNSTKASYGL
jgi:hypothetical protein